MDERTANKMHLVLASQARADIEALGAAIMAAQRGSVGLYATGLDDRLDDLLGELADLRVRLQRDHMLPFAAQPEEDE